MEESDEEKDKAPVDALSVVIDKLILKKCRRIFICGAIDDEMADKVIRQAWYLHLIDANAPITLVINSVGGSVISGFAMWDQLKMLPNRIITLVTGIAASMGSILSLVAEKKDRLATINSRIMIHQPAIHGLISGQVSDLAIHADEINKTRRKIVNIYVDATGASETAIDKDIDRDHWMSAQEAMNKGFVNAIVNDWSEVTLSR